MPDLPDRTPSLQRALFDATLRSIQQTLLDAHCKESEFRGRTVGEQMAWLRQILANNLADQLRRIQRKKRDVGREKGMQALVDRTSARLEGWLAAEQSSPSARVVRAEDAIRLAQALETLTEDQQEAVILRHIRSWSLKEIAEYLDRTPGAVAQLIHRGVAGLRERLGEPG